MDKEKELLEKVPSKLRIKEKVLKEIEDYEKYPFETDIIDLTIEECKLESIRKQMKDGTYKSDNVGYIGDNPPKEVVVHKGLIEKIDIKKMFIEYQNKKDKYGMTVFDYDPPIKEVMIEFGTLVKKSLIEEEKKSGE